MSCHRKTLIECVAVTLFILMTASVLFVALDSDFVRADSCHDSGGRWDDEAAACRHR